MRVKPNQANDFLKIKWFPLTVAEITWFIVLLLHSGESDVRLTSSLSRLISSSFSLLICSIWLRSLTMRPFACEKISSWINEMWLLLRSPRWSSEINSSSSLALWDAHTQGISHRSGPSINIWSGSIPQTSYQKIRISGNRGIFEKKFSIFRNLTEIIISEKFRKFFFKISWLPLIRSGPSFDMLFGQLIPSKYQ